MNDGPVDALIKDYPWIKQFKEYVIWESSEIDYFYSDNDDTPYLRNRGEGKCLNLKAVWRDILTMAEKANK